MKEREERMEGMNPEMKKMMGNGEEYIPVDLYGKRVTLGKGDGTTLEEMTQDNQEVYGLEKM